MEIRRTLRTRVFDDLVDRKLWLVGIEARNDSLVIKWRVTGRNDRGIPQLGLPPNGRTLDVEAITVDSLVDGDLRRFSMIDLAHVIEQLSNDDARAAS